MDFYKDSCCGARQELRLSKQACSSPTAATRSPRSSHHRRRSDRSPIGFGMALAMNHPAMNAYAAMDEAQKQDILNKAHNVRSEQEMHDLMAGLANGTMQ